MGKDKIDKATAVKSMLSDLKKGIDKPSILEKFGKKWKIPTTTYYRWYNEAEKQFLKFKAKADPIIEAKEIEALGEVAKAGILSKLERQKILSDIALGNIAIIKHIVCNGVIEEREVYPSHTDRKAAIAELNKMDGDYAPLKTDLTTNGKEISSSITIEITPPLNDD